jgi:transcriptional regulator with XRE-family HTH domain
MKLNEKILYYRKAAKLSQEELAARVGVSRQAVSKWELGDATPEVDKLLALAKAFGVTTDELLSGDAPAGTAEQAPPPREKPPVYTVPNPPAEDGVDRATGLVGRLVRKYGWIFGLRAALGGLAAAIIGALARWGFGAIFDTSKGFMSGFGDFGGMGGVEFSPNTPPEVQRALLEELGYAPAASPLDGMEGFALGFATVILVIGIVTMIIGAALAIYLYQKGNETP